MTEYIFGDLYKATIDQIQKDYQKNLTPEARKVYLDIATSKRKFRYPIRKYRRTKKFIKHKLPENTARIDHDYLNNAIV